VVTAIVVVIAVITAGWIGTHQPGTPQESPSYRDDYWNLSFCGSSDDVFTGVAIDQSRKILAIGGTYSPDFMVSRQHSGMGPWATLVVLDRVGGLLSSWASDQHQYTSIVQSWDGTMIVAGAVLAHDGSWEPYIAPLSASGEPLEGGYYVESGRGLVAYTALTRGPAQGTLALAPKVTSEGVSEGFVLDFYTLGGDLIWSKKFPSYGVSEWSMTTLDDGTIFVVGTAPEHGWAGDDEKVLDSDGNAWVLKISPDGELLWARALPGQADFSITGVIPSDLGGVFIAGTVSGEDPGFPTIGVLAGFLAEVDSSGTIVWASVYGGSGLDIFTDLTRTTDGNLVVSGATTSFDGHFAIPYPTGVPHPEPYGASLIAKFSVDGTLLWSQIEGGPEPDMLYALEPTPLGGIIAVGSRQETIGDDSLCAPPNVLIINLPPQ